jgi:hypothetical protein
MKWYRSLSREQKLNIRECFEMAIGQSLNSMMRLFTFSECMDILYQKLKLEGFSV